MAETAKNEFKIFKLGLTVPKVNTKSKLKFPIYVKIPIKSK
jgi:hypothetical protein